MSSSVSKHVYKCTMMSLWCGFGYIKRLSKNINTVLSFTATVSCIWSLCCHMTVLGSYESLNECFL